MRFKLLIILLFVALGDAFSQGNSIYQIAPMAVCWRTPENVDSNLVAYWLFSSRETTPKVVSYLTASGTAVVVAGGTVQNGFCCCSGGSQDTLGIQILGDTLILTQNGTVYTYIGGGGSDDDWRWVDPGADETMYEAIYRMGKISVFTEDTTHAVLVDSTYRFMTDGSTSFFEWLRGTEGFVDYKTLMFRAPGGATGAPQNDANNITIARTNATTTRTNLGNLKFAAPYTGGGGAYRVGAQISALDESGGNDTTGVVLDFWTRQQGESFMRQTMTLEGNGRLELDRYNLFQDGIPSRMLGYTNTDKDVSVHNITGNAQAGHVIGINAAGSGLEWKDPDTTGVWLKTELESGNSVSITGNETNSLDINSLSSLNLQTSSGNAFNTVYSEISGGESYAFMAAEKSGASGGTGFIEFASKYLGVIVDLDTALVQIGAAKPGTFNNSLLQFFVNRKIRIVGDLNITNGPVGAAKIKLSEDLDDGGSVVTITLSGPLTTDVVFPIPANAPADGSILRATSATTATWEAVASDTVVLNGSWVNIGANKLRVHSRNGLVSIQGFIRGGTIGTTLPGSPDAELPFGGFLVSNGFQCVANDDGVLKAVAVQDINGDLSFQSLSGGSIDLSGGSDYLFFSITYYNP